MNNFPAMHFPLRERGNNFDSQINIIYYWSKRIPFASSGPFCACRRRPLETSFVRALLLIKILITTRKLK